MVPGLSSANSDAYALRAVAESSQLYGQSLLDRLSGVRSSTGLNDLFGLPGSLLLRPPSDLQGIATGAYRPSIGMGGIESAMPGSAALFATGLASAGNPNMMNAGVGSSALTRHYLQLLQDRQDAANFAQLTGARSQGDASSQYPSGGERHGYNEDSRKY
jgi:hypothetical protein